MGVFAGSGVMGFSQLKLSFMLQTLDFGAYRLQDRGRMHYKLGYRLDHTFVGLYADVTSDLALESIKIQVEQ